MDARRISTSELGSLFPVHRPHATRPVVAAQRISVRDDQDARHGWEFIVRQRSLAAKERKNSSSSKGSCGDSRLREPARSAAEGSRQAQRGAAPPQLQPSSRPRHFVQHFPIRTEQLDPQRHLSKRMGRTTQARIVAADHRLHPVQHPRRQAVPVHIMLGHLQHAAVHRQIVLPGGDNQVHPADQPLLVNLVVMK